MTAPIVRRSGRSEPASARDGTVSTRVRGRMGSRTGSDLEEPFDVSVPPSELIARMLRRLERRRETTGTDPSAASTPCRRDRLRAKACQPTMSADSIRIRSLESPGIAKLRELSDVLRDCVRGGASVGFMLPITEEKVTAFWRDTFASVGRGERVVLVAEAACGEIVGTVQVIWARPENQPHRGEVAKLLVHRRARRRGIGAALLGAAEQCAREAGKSLLVLDTADGAAERLYRRCGWQRVGVVPDYALWPQGGFCATTFFFKDLRHDGFRSLFVNLFDLDRPKRVHDIVRRGDV